MPARSRNIESFSGNTSHRFRFNVPQLDREPLARTLRPTVNLSGKGFQRFDRHHILSTWLTALTPPSTKRPAALAPS